MSGYLDNRRAALVPGTVIVLAAGLTLFACDGGTSDPGSSSSSASSTSGAHQTSSSSYGGITCPSPAPECGGSYPSSSSGTSGLTYVPYGQAIVTATLSGPSCASAGKTVSVGAFADPSKAPPAPAQPVKHGDDWNGGPVEVNCKVSPSGDPLTVMGVISDAKKNEVRVFVEPGADASSSIAFYVTVDKSEYKTRDCTLEYPTNGGAAAGRFWAKISCPTTEYGGTCAISAEVRFEDCQQ